jgi:hypothetical protein
MHVEWALKFLKRVSGEHFSHRNGTTFKRFRWLARAGPATRTQEHTMNAIRRIAAALAAVSLIATALPATAAPTMVSAQVDAKAPTTLNLIRPCSYYCR